MDAIALLMAESFAFDLASQVVGKLGSLALQEVALAWGVTADLDGLKDTLSVIQAVISDAEEQQSNSRQITDWLRKLKKALYEAEDVLDDFEYEALRRKVAKAGSITKQVHSFFSTSNPLPFRFKMGRKMKNLKERLDKIADDRSKFNLTERAVVVDTTHVVHRKREMTHSYVDVSNIIGREQDKENINLKERLDKIADDRSKFNLTERAVVVDTTHVVHRKREMTHSYVDVSNIIGREQDKENIVSILMPSSSDEQENVSVIPIIGIGGMGKTALAKLVYNDGRVVKHFVKRMWVCVSDEDNEIETLTKKILISATMGGTGTLSMDQFQNVRFSLAEFSMDELQTQLRNALDDKRYLLVLDDVWNSDREKWLKLKELLMGGAGGMASVMGTFPAQELKGLPDEDCQSLFLKCAFKDGQGKQYPNLVKIGNQIVKKCGGVPLAVRSLGGLLYSKLEERDWELVRDNEIWTLKEKDDGILPALKLSYDELPSHLKSSFFQDVQDEKVFVWFKMHDLVHDLALSIKKLSPKRLKMPRRLNMRNLQFKIQILASFRFKRTDFEELPSSIGNMKHLRYLDISRNKRIKKLPNVTMWNLCLKDCRTSLLLEAWRLEGVQVWCLCHQDGDEENDIQGISCRLRSLIFVDLPKLEALPRWLIQGLAASTLHFLFIRRCHKFKALPESLENLTSLQELQIDDCPQLSTLSGGMHCLTTLKVLCIDDCPELSKRCKPEVGEDWHKIANVPEIHIDGEAIKSTTNN
ncbi:hypothetical protein AAG906_036637 [Vitis piasezkii]